MCPTAPVGEEGNESSEPEGLSLHLLLISTAQPCLAPSPVPPLASAHLALSTACLFLALPAPHRHQAIIADRYNETAPSLPESPPTHPPPWSCPSLTGTEPIIADLYNETFSLPDRQAPILHLKPASTSGLSFPRRHQALHCRPVRRHCRRAAQGGRGRGGRAGERLGSGCPARVAAQAGTLAGWRWLAGWLRGMASFGGLWGGSGWRTEAGEGRASLSRCSATRCTHQPAVPSLAAAASVGFCAASPQHRRPPCSIADMLPARSPPFHPFLQHGPTFEGMSMEQRQALTVELTAMQVATFLRVRRGALLEWRVRCITLVASLVIISFFAWHPTARQTVAVECQQFLASPPGAGALKALPLEELHPFCTDTFCSIGCNVCCAVGAEGKQAQLQGVGPAHSAGQPLLGQLPDRTPSAV